MATPAQISDLEAEKEFLKELMLDLRQEYIDAGILPNQALWVHQRLSTWTFPFMGLTYTVDIFDMVQTGNSQLLYLSLTYGTPDDMSQPQHWITQARINEIKATLKSWLGL